MQSNNLNEVLLSSLDKWLSSESFIKLTLGDYKGDEPDLKQVFIKPILIKKQLVQSFTYKYQRKDIVKNHRIEDTKEIVYQWVIEGDFGVVNIFLTDRVIFFQRSKTGVWNERVEMQGQAQTRLLEHDAAKQRHLVDMTQPYMQALKLTDSAGTVYKNAQNKWKQINHFIELLKPELERFTNYEKSINIVDMGSGKGYLTFALYDYLCQRLDAAPNVTGVECRQDMVSLCNKVAQESHFLNLKFKLGSIQSYDIENDKLDVLIALHACDTATDDAIFKGIKHQAQVIVVAPCCQKQIRRELKKNAVKNELDFLTKHGVYMERQAEMLTDGLRAMLLEYSGYRVKVMEFVSDMHTPKNVLLIATYRGVKTAQQEQIKEKLSHAKRFFGIDYHHLEKLIFSNNAI